MRPALLALVLLTAGCVGAADPPAPGPSPPSGDADVSAPVLTGVAAPDLPIGRAWTYEGVQQYNPDTPITIVVAKRLPDGYLFATASEDDLVYEALWLNPLLGERDGDLNRVELGRKMLAFPLHDGATWSFSDALALTASAADVATPLGTDAGFVIEGASEAIRMRIEYSPLAGAITRLQVTRVDGTILDDLRMTRIAEGSPATWYERGPLHVVRAPYEPTTFEIPEGFDAVIASAGGLDDAQALVRGPNGEWHARFPDSAKTWLHGVLPATPGRWGAAVARNLPSDAPVQPPADLPIGWAYMHVAPVRWLQGFA